MTYFLNKLLSFKFQPMLPMDTCQCGNPKKKIAKLCITCRNKQTKIDIKWRLENKKEMISANSAKKYASTQKQLRCRRCDLMFKPEQIDKGICHTCREMKNSPKVKYMREVRKREKGVRVYNS